MFRVVFFLEMMENRILHSEFNIAGIEDSRLNFGLTVNSVGYKSMLPEVNVNDSGGVKDRKYQFKKGRVADEFKLIYITRGSGFVRFDNFPEVETRIAKGNILMIMPNQKYQYYHDKESEWKEFFIRFEAESLYHQLIKSLFTNEFQVVDVGFNEELVKLFQRSIDVVKNGLKSSQVYLSGILLHILGLIIAETKSNVLQKREKQLIEQAKIMMNENLLQDITIQDIASRLNTGYTTFRIYFKKHTGLSPARYLQDLRMAKAVELLTETSLSVKEIAYMLQFSYTNQFSTIFRKTMGFSPGSLRSKAVE